MPNDAGCGPGGRRRLTSWILTIVISTILSGCAPVPDVARFQATLDALVVPDGWELALSRIVTPATQPNCGGLFGDCPRAYRYYLADGTGGDVYAAARAMTIGAGFTLDQEIRPSCDAEPARTPACSFTASRDSELLQVSIFNPGEDPDNVGVAASDGMRVRVIAKPK